MGASVTPLEVKTDLTAMASTYEAAMIEFANSVRDYATTAITVPDLTMTSTWIDPSWPWTAMQNVLATAPTSALTLPVNTAEAPSADTIPGIDVPSFGIAPDFVLVPPPLTFPTPPGTSLPAAPGAAPSLLIPTYPDDPVVTLPTAPAITTIVVDDAPFVSIPLYSNDLPDDNLVDPSGTFFYEEPTYQSDMLDTLKAELIDNLLNGGYGIEPRDEQPLWERGREREMLAAETAIEQAMSNAAARGFMIPPGAAFALVEAAQQAALEKVSSINRDIMLKRADLYVENRKFTIEQAREVEQMLITMFGYMAERVLKAAQFLAEFSISVFNAKVSLFNTKMEKFKAVASVYDVQMRAALANLEVWKATLEGKKVAADLQKLYVDVYRAQLDGAKTLVDVYRTRMEAAQIFSNVERSKIEAFKATVDAYVAQVGAKTAEFGMYKAQLDGEMSKVQVYSAQVDAYGKEVSAYGAGVQAKETIVRAQTAAAQLPIEKYRVEIAGYEARLDAYKAEISAKVAEYEGTLKLFQVKAEMEAKAAGQVVAAMEANSHTFIAEAQTKSAHMRGQAEAITAQSRIGSEAAAAGMSQFGAAVGAIATATSGLTAEITTY